MAKLTASRTAQNVLEAEFSFNFDDTMADTSGASKDFGKTNIAATTYDIIALPMGAVVVGGALTVETAFDTASYTVSIGDSANAARYLASADRKAVANTALLTPGYRGDGEPIRVTITNADVCTAGKATVRVLFVLPNRANEVC